LPSSAGRPRIVSKALASKRNAAAMFSGCALAFVCARGSDVSTNSSCEKKVERSGRREGCCDLSSLVEMLCSTAPGQSMYCAYCQLCRLTFVARHGGDDVRLEW
jgi:hypothetical protein